MERVRPKIMTVTAIMAGLFPILWGDGTGASVMKRIAAPMIGGMISSTVLTLVVIPAVYSLWKERGLMVGSGALGVWNEGVPSGPQSHPELPTPHPVTPRTTS